MSWAASTQHLQMHDDSAPPYSPYEPSSIQWTATEPQPIPPRARGLSRPLPPVPQRQIPIQPQSYPAPTFVHPPPPPTIQYTPPANTAYHGPRPTSEPISPISTVSGVSFDFMQAVQPVRPVRPPLAVIPDHPIMGPSTSISTSFSSGSFGQPEHRVKGKAVDLVLFRGDSSTPPMYGRTDRVEGRIEVLNSHNVEKIEVFVSAC